MLSASVDEMKRDMKVNKVDAANLGLDDIGVYASPKAALKLSTLHFAKGREFEAVAMIDLHEGKIPFYKSKTQEEFDAARRLFYVGVTRPRRYLLYVTDASHHKNQPTRFLRSGTGVGVC
jgi:DNA helicase II / ATP-dependent DNA helicase PcrA